MAIEKLPGTHQAAPVELLPEHIAEFDEEARAWDCRTPEVLQTLLIAIAAGEPQAAILRRLADLPEDVALSPEAAWAKLRVEALFGGDAKRLDDAWIHFGAMADRSARIAFQVTSAGEARLGADLYWRLLPAAERFGYPPLLAQTWLGLAGAENTCGDHTAARRALLNAMGWMRRAYTRDWGLVAEAIAMSAIIAQTSGDYRRARTRLNLAIRIARGNGHPIQLARFLRDLGVLLSELNDDGEAEAALRSARALARDYGALSLAGSFAGDLADHLAGQRRYRDSLALFAEAIATPDLTSAQAADVRLRAAVAYFSIGHVVEDQDELAKAEALLLEAMTYRTRNTSWASADMELVRLSQVRLAQGRMAESRACLVASIRASRIRGQRDGAARIKAETQAVSVRMAERRWASAERWARRALDRRLALFAADEPTLLDARQLLSAVLLRSGDTEGARRELEAVIRGEVFAMRRLFDRNATPAEWSRWRLSTQATEVLAALEWRVAARDPSAAHRLAALLVGRRGVARNARLTRRFDEQNAAIDPYDLEALQARLEPDETLVAVVALRTELVFDPERAWTVGFGAPRAFGVLARSQGAPAVIDLGDFAALETAADTWRIGLSEDRLEPFEALSPLLGQLPPRGRVYWMGDGRFEAWPLSALLDPGRETVHLVSPHPRPARNPGAGSLAVVSPDFAPETGLDPHIRAELAAAVGGSKAAFLIGPEATPSAVLSGFEGGWDRIHLICHAGVDEAGQRNDQPYDDAWLVLAHGPLRATAIAQADLRSIDLAVLSACQTGRGVAQHNEGAASLAAAFIDGGAGNVVASHWPVLDTGAARFMQAFYETGAQNPVRALALAASICAREGLPPGVWGAWGIFGQLRSNRDDKPDREG